MTAAFPLSLDTTFGCQLWTGKLDRDGVHGLVWRGARPTHAHRVVFEARVGPIAEDMELDHICRRPLCCAPHHLEPVTRAENEKRKSWRYRARRTHCPKGHDLRVARAVTPEGGITCRTCNREAMEQRV